MSHRQPSDQDIQVALARLEAFQSQPSAIRKRRFKRFPIRCPARLVPSGSMTAPRLEVHVRDVSRGGFGALAAQPIELGLPYRLEPGDGRLVLASVPVFARHTLQLTERAWLLGLEFGVETAVLASMGVDTARIAASENSEHLPPDAEMVDPRPGDEGEDADAA